MNKNMWTAKIILLHMWKKFIYILEPGYNDIGLYVTSSITSGSMWCHLIIYCCL